jgi:hypothetical protein
MSNKSFICGTVRNCGPFLDRVFINIRKLTTILDDFHIIMSYDNSEDNTLVKLKEKQEEYGIQKMDIITHEEPWSHIRVERLSNARNRILHRIRAIRSEDPSWKYFIMLDCDDVCAHNMNEKVIVPYLSKEREQDWDSLSFNRHAYYDMWALSYDPYIFSCWHFQNPQKVIFDMKRLLKHQLSKLKPGELFSCYSAFDGFAIYRLDKFLDCEYRWIIDLSQFPNEIMERNIKIVGSPPFIRVPNEDCEHRSFHFQAIYKNGAKIMISPESIFSN